MSEEKKDLKLEPTSYLQLLHAMFNNAEVVDQQESANAMKWLDDNSAMLEKVCNSAEWGILRTIWEHFSSTAKAPTILTVKEHIRKRKDSIPLGEVIAEYERQCTSLQKMSHFDLPVFLAERVTLYQKAMLDKLLTHVNSINTGTVPMGKGVELKGPLDAWKVLNEEIGKASFMTGVTPKSKGGRLSELGEEFKENLLTARQEKESKKLFMRTGITPLDNILSGGMRRRGMYGILGYAGSRKSSVARTIGYNVARSGYQVLHITIETDLDEEMNFYHSMHTLTQWTSDFVVRKSSIDNGELATEEERFIIESVAPSFRDKVGKNIRVFQMQSNSWPELRALIERQLRLQPVDLVICDYITMFRTPGARDERDDKASIVAEVKQHALTNNYAFLTPVQGSRNGLEEATKNGGAWEKSGVWMYSEVEKSLDVLAYVYTSVELQKESRAKVGTCKNRRGLDLAPTFVSICEKTGMFTSVSMEPVKMAETAAASEQATNAKPLSLIVPNYGYN